MLETKITPFQDVIAIVEAMSDEDQVMLAEIIRKRVTERRRAELVASVREAEAEYAAGKAHPMSVEEIMRRIEE